MTYAIQDVQNDLAGVIHGTSISKVTNLYNLLNRTARQLLQDVDLMETKRIVQIGQVFNSVYDYSAPSDLKGNRIIDIRQQAGRKGDTWPQRFNQFFDKTKWLANQNMFTIQHNTGVKSLRIASPSQVGPIVLDSTSSATNWLPGALASNVTLDTQFNVAGSGAIQFDQTGNGYLENSALSSVDLTKHKNISTLFLWVNMPTILTSVELRFGSSAANYYLSLQSVRADGTAFQVGWNLISVPWAGLAPVGVPVITAFNYMRVTTNGASMVGLKIDYPVSILGTILEVEYYSKFLFRNPTTNAFQETVVSDTADLSTILNLDTESYNLYFNLSAYYISQQLQGSDATFDTKYWMGEYEKSLKRYKNLYPSEIQPVQEAYYSVSKGNYDGFVPGVTTRP